MLTYLIDNMWLVWLVIAFACLILELSSGDFYITCFAVGAVVAIFPAICDSPMWLQILIWAIGSVLSIYFIRPVLLRRFHPKSRQRKSNADALIGCTGIVTETIENDGYGWVKVYGDIWKAHSIDGKAILKGESVCVVSRDSIILTVKAIHVNEHVSQN